MTDWLGMAAAPKEPRSDLKARVLARALAARRRRVPPWALAVAAGAAVLLAGATYAVRAARELEGERALLAARVSALEDTLGLIRSSGTRVMQIPVTTNGRLGHVTIFDDTLSHRWLVACHNLAPNQPGEAYQIWFITDRGMASAAVMPMDRERPMVFHLNL